MLFLRPTLLCCVIFMLLFLQANGQAEHRIWDQTRQIPGKAQQKAQKTGTRIKKFREHLEKWGLDSSYRHGLAIGGRLNNTGWMGLMYYQQRVSRTTSRFYQLSFSEIRHEKQVKQQGQNKTYPELGNTTPFVYGKINNAYQLQLGYGREYLLLPGVLDGNMSVSIRCQAGFSMTLLKPYYLKLIYVTYTPGEHATVEEQKYDAATAAQFLKTGSTLGAAAWKKGWDEVRYLPGIYADVSVCIEPLRNKTFIKTVTLGSNLSVHSGNIELMAHQKAYPWNAAVYAGLSFGKRWK